MTAALGAFDPVVLLAIAGMGIATAATRVGGFWLMSHVSLSARLERFLRQSAGGVLIAIVVAAAMKGDTAMWVGLAVIVGLMIALRRSMLAIAIGTLVAIGLRALL